MKGRGILTTAIVLFTVFVSAAAFDWLTDASRFVTFRVFVAAVGLMTCLVAAALFRRAWPLIAWPLFVAAVWGLAWWDHSPVKPFARFYAAIEMGMTRAEVQAELEREYGWSGSYTKPEVFSVQSGHLGYQIHPPGWSDVMVVSLYFEDDRVVYRSLHDD